MTWQLGVKNGAPVPHSPLDSHTSPGYAASQFHETFRLVDDGHLSGGTSRRQMPQDDPASQVPHAGFGGAVGTSLKARAFVMRQEVMRRAAVGDIRGRARPFHVSLLCSEPATSRHHDGATVTAKLKLARLSSGRPREICSAGRMG